MTLTNSISLEGAKATADKLNAAYGGQTYFKFKFGAWPIGGSIDIGILNVPEGREGEARDLLLNLMVEAL